MGLSPEVTLTGVLLDTSGNPVPYGTVTLTLANYGAIPPIVAGTGLFASTYITTTADVNGVFSVTCYGNYQISPSNTFYSVALAPDNLRTTYQFLAAGTFDLSTVTPYGITYSNPVVSPNGVIFAEEVVPTGTINGINAVFTLPHTPSPISSLNLFLNGLRMTRGVGFTITGNTITYATGFIPQTGDSHVCSYRYSF